MKKSHHRSESSSDSSSLDSEDKKRIKKLKKKLKKEQKKKEKIVKRQIKEERRKNKKLPRTDSSASESLSDQSKCNTSDIPIQLMEKSRAMAPMTKEEWDQKQSVVKRVLDPETGRHRLIKGDGEVLEEIVSRERHREINRQATRADGESFQAQTTLRLKK